MSQAHGRRRKGGAASNVLLALAVLFLVAALLAPQWRTRMFDLRAESIAAGVDGLRAEAQRIMAATGSWPATSAGAALVSDFTPADSTVAMEWRRIASTVVPEPPSGVGAALPETDEVFGPEPPAPAPAYFERGAISVRSADEAVLGSLLERYPGSFVHDTVWTLLLPRISAPPQ